MAALEAGLTPARYVRSIPSFGLAGQARLLESRVGVVGSGGLGGFLIEILARAGVGRLVVADKDTFEPTNFNRQILCTSLTLGRAKARAAAERVRLINPAVDLEPVVERVTEDNVDRILAGVQVVADALDNVPDRLMIEVWAKRAGVPLVFGAVAGFMGQVTTVFPGDPGLERIFGPRDKAADKGTEVDFGVPPMTPPLVAARQAGEIINILLGRTEQLLRGRLWVVDMMAGRDLEVDLG
ncbi:MAG: ThiF family adenylyltransferase [Proteobacteria bacterium]|nr:ThiF family adenylyltransferase [Pseudomonadota bacterium]MBU1742385.1 ThiF family adenylyltransferase [Pseudomonadota bacterium]